jgi:predicted ATPase/transcriptional regulator with XRE-family HTH domain
MFQQFSFGYWLRLRRKALDLTREELADRVGCSAATIRKIEAEERRPSAQIAGLLARTLNIPTEEQAAFLRFARGDQDYVPPEPSENVPWRESHRSTRSNIPAPTTSLIGRERELIQLHGYLKSADIRLVTLSGPPGIGKTRLSIEIGRTMLSDFPDGVFFVPLAPLDDPTQVASSILHSISYVEAKNSLLAQELVEGIGNKRLLLVLDNCEHLIEQVALIASELLAGCPYLKILVTSREALRVPGEWLYPVPALEIPETPSMINIGAVPRFPAVALFYERARAVRPDFQPTEKNVQAVASICSRLDGLPLAIELIAARVRLMSPQSLLERLTDAFVLSADGRRAVSLRQKTLGDAFNFSYQLLSPEEQKILAYASVFTGGFTLEAGEAVFSKVVPDKSVPDLILSLSDKSLLQRNPSECDEVRHSMLFTVQRFTLHCLKDMGKEPEARDLHLAYFLKLAEEGEKEMRGAHQAIWGKRLEMEHQNFRAALDWSLSNHQVESTLRLLCALGWSWEVHAHYIEANNWLEKIRLLPETAQYPGIYARFLNHLGRQHFSQANYREALSLLEESRNISINLGADGEGNLAETCNWIGIATLWGLGDHRAARLMLEESLALSKKLGDNYGVALTAFHLGILESDLGHSEAARSHYEQSLTKFQEFGDLFFIARVSLFLGYEYLKKGNLEKTQYYFEEQFRIDQELQFWDGVADGLRNLGKLAFFQRKFDQAEEYYNKSLAVSSEHYLHQFDTLYYLGLVALHGADYLLAYQRMANSLEMALKSRGVKDLGDYLCGLAVAAAGANLSERAVKLNAAGQMILETAGISYPSRDLEQFNHLIESARGQAGEDLVQSLTDEGRRMSIEEIVAYALTKDL